MSKKENEAAALKEDYQLVPDWRSVLILRTVRRALAGDTELAAALMYLAGFWNEIDRRIEEDSVVLNTLFRKRISENAAPAA